jgi:hypothetical protein
VALTEAASSRVTVQVGSAPVQAPDQPLNSEPGAGVAVRVSVPPASSSRSQESEQSSLAEALVIEPEPIAAVCRAKVGGESSPKKPDPGGHVDAALRGLRGVVDRQPDGQSVGDIVFEMTFVGTVSTVQVDRRTRALRVLWLGIVGDVDNARLPIDRDRRVLQ